MYIGLGLGDGNWKEALQSFWTVDKFHLLTWVTAANIFALK